MEYFRIERYYPGLKGVWDDFVSHSKNATFLFRRDFMDYHAERFVDHSLIVFRRDKIYALLPASENGTVIYSHGGLTYGGLLTDSRATGAEILTVLKKICIELRKEGFHELIYKPVPHIYHCIPAEEDLYALFRMSATLESRLLSCAVRMDHRIKFRDIRKSGIRKAKANGILVQESSDFKSFWNILSQNLMQSYGAIPVHSLKEIELLTESFPENIRLHSAFIDGEMVAGVVIFLSANVAHTQYISASPIGKATGALDLLFANLLDYAYKDLEFFDFGTSNEENGRYLNQSLLYQKEGFGARGICYDTYKINLHSSALDND